MIGGEKGGTESPDAFEEVPEGGGFTSGYLTIKITSEKDQKQITTDDTIAASAFLSEYGDGDVDVEMTYTLLDQGEIDEFLERLITEELEDLRGVDDADDPA